MTTLSYALYIFTFLNQTINKNDSILVIYANLAMVSQTYDIFKNKNRLEIMCNHNKYLFMTQVQY